MKQEITKEQWDELDLDTQGKIIESVNVSVYGMTIGEMIEFLGDDLVEGLAITKDGWTVFMEDFIVKKEELANALWEAVKHKLKQ